MRPLASIDVDVDVVAIADVDAVEEADDVVDVNESVEMLRRIDDVDVVIIGEHVIEGADVDRSCGGIMRCGWWW